METLFIDNDKDVNIIILVAIILLGLDLFSLVVYLYFKKNKKIKFFK
jgi:hypothetical protein